MSRQFFSAFFVFAGVWALSACASVPHPKPAPLGMSSVKAADEPCWVSVPDCIADPAKPALYFVGQSDAPRPSWGRPTRDSLHSAQHDAEQQYARYLGVEIKSSMYLQSLFDSEQYQSQFEHTVTAHVDRQVSELYKADEYFVAHQQTSEGEPIWTVYVLIKIAEKHVKKHRLAVTEEAKVRAAAPPPPDEWVASVFNLDDGVSLYVNGTKINQCGFSQSCEIKLNPHFKKGRNTVRLDYVNRLFLWTYGYEIFKNEEIMYRGRCGQVWLFGCGDWDTRRGIVHTFEFTVEMP